MKIIVLYMLLAYAFPELNHFEFKILVKSSKFIMIIMVYFMTPQFQTKYSKELN